MSSKLNQWCRRWIINADEATTRTRCMWQTRSEHGESQQRLQLSGLEPRILFSATPIDPSMMPTADEPAMVAEVETAASTARESTIKNIAETHSINQTPREIILIDSAVADIEQLLDDLASPDRNAEVFVLDKDRDGIDQITEILDSRSEIGSLHIISHAEEGAVKLGNLWLGASNLDPYAGQIASWQDALSSDADILLYGCELAGSADGRTLIESVSSLSGAEVAASIDDTGHNDFGGDWELEYSSGAIDSQVALSAELQHQWRGKLALITVDTFDDVINGSDGVTSLREAVLMANAGGGGDTIDLSTLGAGTFLLDDIGGGDDASISGDLDIITDVTILGVGAGSTIIDGGGIDRVFHVLTGNGNLTMSDLTIQGGIASGGDDGGGILVGNGDALLTLDRVVVTNNFASHGAGIHNLGTMTLRDVWIAGNGDALLTAEGGGVRNNGTATLDRVTLSLNAAVDGGGIHNDIVATSLSLTNVTISGNTASGVGGGIHNQSTSEITSSSVVLNSANRGGGIANAGGSVDLLGSIVASNSASTSPDVDGTITSNGYNLIGDGSGSTGAVDGDNNDQVGNTTTRIDPMIDPVLADNGGLVPTHALANGSPAINPGTPTGTPTVDARNVSRDPYIDIGAFEAPNIPPVITSSGTSNYIEGEGRKTVGPLITISDSNDTHIEAATVRITLNHTPTEDRLYFANQNGISGIFDAATGVLSLSGAATIADYRTALRSLEYENTSVNPNTLSRWIEFEIFDSEATESTVNVLNITSVGPITVDTTSDADNGDTSSISALMNDKGIDGKISLREAILAANNTLGTDAIHFEIDEPLVNGAHTIEIGAIGLPDIIDSIVIDGWTDDDFAGTPIIELNGAAYSGDGLSLITGSDNSAIRGLVINRFGDDGIDVTNSNSNTIIGNYIGTDVTGTVDLGNANDGIQIENADFNIIGSGMSGEGNLISGNNDDGIAVENSNATVIQGNLVGVDVTGNVKLENDDHGILLHSGTSGTLIGGTNSDQANVVSGNLGAGIRIRDAATTDNDVFGNYIGTDRDATVAIGNSEDGIAISAGASAITIGGSTPGKANVISGNLQDGIHIADGSDITIQGNFIGTGNTGTDDLHNFQSGIQVDSPSATSNVHIGGAQPGEGNTVAFNLMRGVYTLGNGSGDRIEGNVIHDQGLSGIFSLREGGMVIAKNVIHNNSQLASFDELVIGDNHNVFHNTIHGSADGGISIEGINAHLHNNIITGSAGFGIRVDGGSILDESSNLITDAVTGPANQLGQANVPLDASDFSADPLYLDSANGIFLLDASSTANNGGVDLGAEQIDMNGAVAGLFNGIAPDVGAFEGDNATPILSQPIPDQVAWQATPLNFQFDETTFSDPDGDVLIYTATLSSGASLPAWLSFDAANRTFSGTPSAADFGAVSIRVRADDGNNHSAIADFALTVNPDVDPSDLAGTLTYLGGLSLNEDGGNNAYLIADDGSELIGGQTAVSLEVQFKSTTMPPVSGNSIFVSYANGVNADGDDLRFGVRRNGVNDFDLELGIDGNYVVAAGYDASLLFDGETHRTSVTWDNSNGEFRFYVDGDLVHSGSGLAVAHILGGGGALTIGADQDSIGGGFEANQVFQGSLLDARIFNDVRTPAEIAYGYDRSLPYATDGMIANWHFNDLSTNGVVTDSVSGNNVTLQSIPIGGGFSSGYPELTYEVVETAPNNTFVGVIRGIDAERNAAIAELLAGNANLSYSAETGKFYEYVSGATTWAGAATDSMDNQLEGVDGRLVTIRSAAEQEIVHAIAAPGGQSIWLGGSDRNIEGDWRWYDGLIQGNRFWSGDFNGSISNGAYQNWDPSQPDNVGDQDYLQMSIGGAPDGLWSDSQVSLANAYVVEWNADDVLDQTDALVYSMIDDAGGRFSIHPDYGTVRIANASLIDYETTTFHDVTVRVTDVFGNQYDETFRIDVREVNEAPTDITLDNADVLENATGAVIGNLGVVDYDAGESHTWSVNDGRFEIVGTQLKLKVAQSLDREAEPTVDVRVTAVDKGGTGLSYDEWFTITVDNVNETPNDIMLSNLSVDENIDGGVIGSVAPVDPDIGDTHTWSVDDARFEIVGGQLKLKNGQSLDTESEPSVDLDITTIDQGGNGFLFKKSFTITVDNVNEAPVTNSDTHATTAGDSLSVDAPGVLEGDTDPENDPFTARLLTGPSNGILALSADGSFDYTPDPGFVGVDSFTYEAWDGSASSVSTIVTINVVPGLPPAPPPPVDPGDNEPPADEPKEDSPEETETPPPPILPGAGGGTISPPSQENSPGTNPIIGLSDLVNRAWAEPVAPMIMPPVTESSAADDSAADLKVDDTRLSEADDRFGRSRLNELIATGSATQYPLMARPGLMWNELDNQLDYVDSQIHGDLIVVGTAGAAASSFTVGVVAWTLRTGFLASGLLAQMPAWRLIDPMLIMQGLTEQSDDEETLEELMRRRSNELDD